MGHSIAGFIARRELLRQGTRHLCHAVIAPLEQGFGFLPATGDLHDELGDGSSPYDEFWGLSDGLARLGAELSRGGRVAYVETDYFGGTGDQAAMVWEDGEIRSQPSKMCIGAIHRALMWLDVEQGDADDRFDALGLGRHRHTDDWADAARDQGGQVLSETAALGNQLQKPEDELADSVPDALGNREGDP